MIVYLPEVRRNKGEAVKYRFRGKTAELGLSLPEEGELDLAVEVRSSGDKIIVDGTLMAAVGAECSRCLQPFDQKLRSDFHEAFTVLPGLVEHRDRNRLAEEAANQLVVTGDYLYLEEYVRQVFILAQEYNPLCKPDCKGICAGCGVDLNRSACRCREEQEVDARLAKLKQFGRASE